MNPPFAPPRALVAACLLLAGGVALAAAAPASEEEAFAALQAAYARSVAPGEQADLYHGLFTTVLHRVKRSYATEVDVTALAAAAVKVLEPLPPAAGAPAEVFKKAIQEALRTLDPHSRYLDARTFGNERGDASGSFGGLGLEVQAGEGGAVRVVAPMPDSPAARAGVEPGDLIVRVDDQPLAGLPLAEAIARMRGQPGTPVLLTIQRGGAEREFTLALTRDTIRRQVVRWSMEGDVLVLRLATFSGPAFASLEKAIAEATAQAAPAAVVLDLRGNPGGLLQEAVRVADAFLGQGEIVSLRGSTPGRQRAWQADAGELLAGVPMVLLIDGRSASASELVADALQAHGRATVMGQRSFGKGSVQTTYFLGEQRGALKLTTALYYGPSGHTVHRVGVAPDIELLAGPKAAAPAGPRLAKARVDPSRCTVLKERDPVLSCALAYLQAGNIADFAARHADVAP